MKKIALLILAIFAVSAGIFAFTFFEKTTDNTESTKSKRADISGVWNLTDMLTGDVDSAVLLYENDGIFYGRMVAIYNDDGKITDTYQECTQRAKGLKGNPTLCSFDFIWGLKWNEQKKKYIDGKLIDPDSGSIYDCEAWKSADKDEVDVVCQVAIFWKTMHWKRSGTLPESAYVNPKKIKPNIPR